MKPWLSRRTTNLSILTTVLSEGFPAVEAACSEALREGEGVHSADVIINILARRGEPAPPITIDTGSPMGRATFTIIGAMAELEASLISERVTAGTRAAEARAKHLGRPAIHQRVVNEIQALATSTDLSIRLIHAKIEGRASRGIVGEITKRVSAAQPATL